MVLASILILAILFQSSEKGLDGAFGGSGNSGESMGHTRRGIELRLYHITIFVSLLLAGSLLVTILVA